jgi:hypothetical protein
MSRETGGSGAGETARRVRYSRGGGVTQRGEVPTGTGEPPWRASQTRKCPLSVIVSKDALSGKWGGLTRSPSPKASAKGFPPSKGGELLTTVWLCEGHDR